MVLSQVRASSCGQTSWTLIVTETCFMVYLPILISHRSFHQNLLEVHLRRSACLGAHNLRLNCYLFGSIQYLRHHQVSPSPFYNSTTALPSNPPWRAMRSLVALPCCTSEFSCPFRISWPLRQCWGLCKECK